MLCKKPVASTMGYWPCGQCLPCRINKRRIWTNRIVLEGLLYQHKTFVTLTYTEDDLVYGKTTEPILVRKDFQDFMKRLRRRYKLPLRYFAVGEYGKGEGKEQINGRPHYHIALFNYPNCEHGNSRYSKTRETCCRNCELIREVWGKGNVFLGSLERKSAQYVAGYTTKKMTAESDERLRGRTPEFATMSLKPGIGAEAMAIVAKTLLHYGVCDDLDDVPKVLRMGKKLMPTGNYLTKRLRKEVGRDTKIPQAEFEKVYAPVYDVLLAASKSEEVSPLAHIQTRDLQKIRNLEGKEDIFKKRSVI